MVTDTKLENIENEVIKIIDLPFNVTDNYVNACRTDTNMHSIRQTQRLYDGCYSD